TFEYRLRTRDPHGRVARRSRDRDGRVFPKQGFGRSGGRREDARQSITLDGRGTPPAAGAQYVAALQRKLDGIGCGEIATVVGRYYAMDREKRWERTK